MDQEFLEHVRVTVLGGDGESVHARMEDDPCLDNHVASRHAGALFSLADTTAWALIERTFGTRAEACPAPEPLSSGAANWARRRTTIDYQRIARGALTATARWEQPGITVEIRDDRGHVVCAAQVETGGPTGDVPADRC